MEETGGGFRKDLVSKLLQLHFTDGKTKALKLCVHWLGLLSCQPARGWGRQPKHPHPASPTSLSSYVVAETAVRSIRQAQAEDLALVDVDQLEKVLPQLLLDF
ncbi:centromere protein X isoform X1 [Ursus maritimus]|uniref:Centromere protein X isoform X1 n=1 Tax=Ursus maritimus TaxID=29073 RepID=A0A8M1GLM2_URSMA|nr:centromere protein X isoform X1 [Ursus maritimus]